MKRTHWLNCIGMLATLFLFATALSAADIGVAWVGKAGMANNVLKGFMQGISGSGINAEYHKELASIDELAKVVADMQKNKAGMVILRSNGAEWLTKNPPSIPTFIGGCNNPQKLGVVKNLNAPEGKITGVTYYIPAKIQIGVMKTILPNMKSLMLLMEKGNPSAAIDEDDTKSACAAMGIAYSGKQCSSIDDALATVKDSKDKVSAFVIGSQSLIIDNTPKILDAAGKTPCFAYSEKPINTGALGGYVADDEKLGKMLAQSVIDVLVKGKAIKDVPVKVDPEPAFYLNGTTYVKLGLEIPPKILGAAKIIK